MDARAGDKNMAQNFVLDMSESRPEKQLFPELFLSILRFPEIKTKRKYEFCVV